MKLNSLTIRHGNKTRFIITLFLGENFMNALRRRLLEEIMDTYLYKNEIDIIIWRSPLLCNGYIYILNGEGKLSFTIVACNSICEGV